MNKLTKKERLFIESVKFACKKAKIKTPKIKGSNRMKIYLAYAYCEDNKIIYNKKLIKKQTELYIKITAFHEIGHFLNKEYYRWKREYKAEKHALKLIKKYFSKRHYLFFIDELKYQIKKYKRQKKKWQKTYLKAYTKILKEENQL